MGRPLIPAKEKFWRNVSPEPNTGCWLWAGEVQPEGYGRFTMRHGHVSAHRFAWELFHGPIPEGFHIDHLCRVPSCVNPDHLGPVTCKTNLRRGIGFAAINGDKTHCIRGHEFTEENTYLWRGHRHCKQCRQINRPADHKEYMKRYHQKRREAQRGEIPKL